MQLLSSKNYSEVRVYLRDDGVVIMPPQSGLKLMDYLTGNLETKHVKLTDKDGTVTVVLITDIKKVEPIVALGEFDESKYL